MAACISGFFPQLVLNLSRTRRTRSQTRSGPTDCSRCRLPSSSSHLTQCAVQSHQPVFFEVKNYSKWSDFAQFLHLQPPRGRCQIAAKPLTMGNGAIWQSSRAKVGGNRAKFDEKVVPPAQIGIDLFSALTAATIGVAIQVE